MIWRVWLYQQKIRIGSIGENLMQDDDDLVSTAEALRIDAGTKFCRQRDDSYDKKNRFVQAAYKIIEKGESNGRESFLVCIS